MSSPKNEYDFRRSIVKTSSGMIDLNDPAFLYEQHKMLAAFSYEEGTFSDHQDQTNTSSQSNSDDEAYSESNSPDMILCHQTEKKMSAKRHNHGNKGHDSNKIAHKQTVMVDSSCTSLHDSNSNSIGNQHQDTGNNSNKKCLTTSDNSSVNNSTLASKDTPHEETYASTIKKIKQRPNERDRPQKCTSSDDQNDVLEMYKHHGITIRGKRCTWDAIANGDAMLVQCIHCSAYLQVRQKAKLIFCSVCSTVSPPATNIQKGQEGGNLGDDCSLDSKLAERLQEQEFDAALSKDLNELNMKS